ncbi:MAG TPA: response regulator [Aggregatilinea sp.]|uniref:response regulator n=1 Tax=Aggregatilinea sp. TaxID=2806333 RepID=UPI002CC615F4|nr:response regulator [Aggregatilinea sp.]HML23169.1 response regulator [Aggregatilinea sp.]
MGDTRRKVILLVEDNPDDVSLTLRAFRKSNLGIHVDVATDGAEALEYLFKTGAYTIDNNGELPALVLLDLKLPKLDGVEVLQHLRADERTRLLPVVILTSSREQEDLIGCYSHGANSYIRKPVDFDRFSSVVQQLGIYWLELNESPI